MKAYNKVIYFSCFFAIFTTLSSCNFSINDINSYNDCFIQGLFKINLSNRDNYNGIYYFDVKYITNDEFEDKKGLNVVYDTTKDKYLSLSLYKVIDKNYIYYDFNNLKYDSSEYSKYYKRYIDINGSYIEVCCDSEKNLDNNEDIPLYDINIKDEFTLLIGSHDLYIDYRN